MKEREVPSPSGYGEVYEKKYYLSIPSTMPTVEKSQPFDLVCMWNQDDFPFA